MSISDLSFWQQNRNYWYRAAQRSQSLASSAALMSVMSDAITNQARGMASIANQTALNRTNAALSAAVQSALQGPNAGKSSSSSTASGSAPASASASPGDTAAISGPATGTGKVPLTGSTSLQTFHIIKGGTFSVSDGIGATVYTSNGHDTVGDVINAINSASPGHAQAFAWIDDSGKLKIAATDTSHTITIGGTAAAALGFGAGNNSFQPATNTTSTSPASASATPVSGSSGQSSNTTKPASPSPKPFAQNSAAALLTGGTAEILLASNGSPGFLVNLLA